MRGLLTSELYRWLRRPEIVGLLVGLPAVVVLQYAVGVLNAVSLADSASAAGDPTASEFFLSSYAAPASVVARLVEPPWILLAAVYIGAATTGFEYSWGTIRNLALAANGRGGLMLAHAAAVAVMTILVAMGVAAAGLVAPSVAMGLGVQLPPSPVTPDAGLAAVVGVVVASLVYAALGVAAATLVRSGPGGLLAVAGYFAVEKAITGLPAVQSETPLGWALRSLPLHTADGLMSAALGLVGMPGLNAPAYLSWPINVIAVVVWAGALVAAAAARLIVSDLTA